MVLDKCRSEHMEQLRQLYFSSFPKQERRPFWFIKRKAGCGKMEILEIEENGSFVGLVITALYKDLVLLDYLAISENARNGGIGSETLKYIRKRYSGCRIFGEIELPSGCGKDEMKIRRKGFYLRNGAKETGIYVKLFGVPMEVLVLGESLSYDEYIEFYKKVMGRATALEVELIEDKSEKQGG